MRSSGEDGGWLGARTNGRTSHWRGGKGGRGVGWRKEKGRRRPSEQCSTPGLELKEEPRLRVEWQRMSRRTDATMTRTKMRGTLRGRER